MKQFLVVFLIAILAIVNYVNGETYFFEPFKQGWEQNWIQSKAKSDYGEMKATAGDWYGDAEEDVGLQTSQDARNYATSSEFRKVFSNRDKPLVLQYSVKHPQGIDCGGAYLKVLPEGTNQEQFKDDTEYRIMFGPDICGATKRVHFIFNYDGQNLLWKKTLPCETDKLTHVYTAIVHTNQTYEVLIDGVQKETGNLYEDWDFLPPKQIPDPNAKKPEDWVDEAEIPDPNDKKPEDWDQPRYIPDPEAKKPEDWNDEEDGEWEPPQIPNPEYKGEWKPRMIPNPAYKGEWTPPLIDNPDYKDDPNCGKYDDMKYVGIEVWQVKSGTIFDNILVTDSIDEAKQESDKILERAKSEKEMYDKQQQQQEEESKSQETQEENQEDQQSEQNQEEQEKKEEEEMLNTAAPESSEQQQQQSGEEQKSSEEL